MYTISFFRSFAARFFVTAVLCIAIAPLAILFHDQASAVDPLAIAGPYDTATGGTGNISDGGSVRTFLQVGQAYRIRQSGTITRIKMYVHSAVSDEFRLQIWRKNANGTFNRVAESANIAASLTAGQINTVDLPQGLAVLEGDYYGYKLDSSDSPLFARTGVEGVTMYYATGADPGTTNVGWTAYSSIAGAVVPIELYMQAPEAVFLGDSIIAGHPNHFSFIETTDTTNITSTIEHYFAGLTNMTYQNMGIGGQTTTQIAARFTQDVLSLHPTEVAILEGGVNDLAQGVSQTTFLNNWTTMLNAAEANNIDVLLLLILPWTNGSTAQMNTRDTWNAALSSLAAGYDNVTVVDASTYVGEFRSDGPTGNYWKMKPAYDVDGVHFNDAGHAQIAQALFDALPQVNQPPVVNAGTDQTVVFPNAAALNGTVTDDGLPNPPLQVTTTWSKVSGPGTVTFGSAALIDTTATFSAVGTYVLRLSATDSELSSADELIITVGNQTAPTVSAGADFSVSISNAGSLNGTVTDDGYPNPPGSVTSLWTKVSGPGTATFGNANAVDTTATFSEVGTYVLRLTADDSALSAYDEVTVTVTNSDPNLVGYWAFDNSLNDSIGSNHGTGFNGVGFSTNGKFGQALSLDGVNDFVRLASDPTSGNTALTMEAWIKYNNAGQSKGIAGAWNGDNAMSTLFFTGSNNHGYMREKMNAGGAWTAQSSTNVQNNAWHHIASTFGGGQMKLYIDGVLEDTVTISGTIATTSNPFEIGRYEQSNTRVPNGLIDDLCIWKRVLTAAEISNHLTAPCGGPPQNQSPIVSAGTDQSVSYPNAALLDGTVTDDGLPGPTVTTAWTKVSGPGTVSFGNANAVDTTATFSALGTYVLRLTGDDGELSAYDEITVTVNAQAAPSVNVGADFSVNIANAATLDATVTDDGLPNPPAKVTVQWSKISGPGTVTFGSAALVDTTATFSAVGTYVLRLTADDSALSAYDEVTVTVQAGGPSGLTGYWTFDGNFQDSAGSNHGTGFNGVGFSTGKFGQALSLDGVNDFVRLASDPTSGKTGLTIGAWIKFNNANQSKGIAGAWNGDSAMSTLFFTGSNNHAYMRVRNTSGGVSTAQSVTSVQNNQWHYIVGAYDGTLVKIYVDGVLEQAEAANGTTASSSELFEIGRYESSSGRVPSGLIDDLCVVNRALTQAEITAFWNGGTGIACGQ